MYTHYRIIDGGKYYKGQLYAAVSKGDWDAIKSMTQEPPKKTKEDRALADGGVAKRAALAGGSVIVEYLRQWICSRHNFPTIQSHQKLKQCRQKWLSYEKLLQH